MRAASTPGVALFLPSLAGGGAERVFVELANQFAAFGLRTSLVLASASGPYVDEVEAGVRVVDLASSGVSRSLPRLIRELRHERPAALLSALEHANVAAVAACRLGARRTRCVVSMRGVPAMLNREAGRRAAWTVLHVARIAYRLADAIVANSHGVADGLAAYLGIPRSRVDVIYNPLNIASIERLAQASVEHPFCRAGEPPLVLSAGRLSALKDFPTLIRALAIVRASRRCRLAILGEGPDRDALLSLIRECGLENDVALPGFDPNPYAWMRRSAMFVSSSLSEGCPNALMQALACGTPVVSTDSVGGSAEIIEGGRWGKLVPVQDPAALAAAISATLDATTFPDVRRRAQDFAIDRIAREYLRVLMPQEMSAVTVR